MRSCSIVFGKREAEIVFRKHAGFPVQVHIVAVVLYFQVGHFHHPGLLSLRQGLKFHLECDVFGSIAGRIDVRDVGGDKLLPRRRPRSMYFSSCCETSVEHTPKQKQAKRQDSPAVRAGCKRLRLYYLAGFRDGRG